MVKQINCKFIIFRKRLLYYLKFLIKYNVCKLNLKPILKPPLAVVFWYYFLIPNFNKKPAIIRICKIIILQRRK